MEGMHIVLSTKKDLAYPDALVKQSLDEAIKALMLAGMGKWRWMKQVKPVKPTT